MKNLIYFTQYVYFLFKEGFNIPKIINNLSLKECDENNICDYWLIKNYYNKYNDSKLINNDRNFDYDFLLKKTGFPQKTNKQKLINLFFCPNFKNWFYYDFCFIREFSIKYDFENSTNEYNFWILKVMSDMKKFIIDNILKK